jgi:hypothetical protein
MAVLSPAPTTDLHTGPRLVRYALVLIVVTAALLPASAASAQSAGASEYEVKAAYLLNFARFVEWPADVLPANSPLDIVIVGDDPFGRSLEGALQGKMVNGHPVRLRRLRWDAVLSTYQIVFISASEEPHLDQILRYLGRSSVLTVSDIDRFSLRGGVIELVMVGNRVRFDINREPAATARLGISSKLFNVARAIHEKGATR